MSELVKDLRCGQCKERCRFELNMLTDKMTWLPPKKKRGGCQHPTTEMEWMGPDGEWRKQGRYELSGDADFCFNGWGPTEKWPSCNYTGGHYCEREDGHPGRCRCVCGSTSRLQAQEQT